MFDSITDRRRPGRRRRAGAALLASLMAVSGLGAVGLGSGQRIVAVEDRSVLPLVFEVEAPPPLPAPNGGSSVAAVTAPPVAEPPLEPPALEPDAAPVSDPQDAVADLEPETPSDGPVISNGPGLGTGTQGLGTDEGPPGSGPGCEGDDCGPAEVHWTQVQVQRQVNPIIPAAARDLGPMEVRCVLRFVVDVKGRPESVSIEQCPALFQQSALSAARRWRFVPMTVDGAPQAATFRLAITYRVD